MSKERKEKIYYPWQDRYPKELGLVRPGELRILPDCAWIFPQTEEILEKWKNRHNSVIINTVVVSPNEGELPLRVMSYLLGAAQMIQSLRRFGLKVDGLRVINPGYLNVYCDGGNIGYQLSYGQRLIGDLQNWMKKYFPDLSNVQLILDQGAPIDEDRVMVCARDYVAKINPAILDEAQRRVKDHNAQEDRIALYLLAHPLAWQYEAALDMFMPRDEGATVINYMPQSEMFYLATMRQAGVQIDPLTSDVVTSISRRIIHTPYYPLREDELTLDWSIDANTLQNTMTNLRPMSGNTHIAEILSCLGHIRAQTQQVKER